MLGHYIQQNKASYPSTGLPGVFFVYITTFRMLRGEIQIR